ncbi:uncharacterized protein METZ01_LOCUS450512, partial [marine metagenome]
ESDDVVGCTDPDAVNYNSSATIDDGSCYYAGDSCNIALDFSGAGGTIDGSASVTGATTYSGDVEWYYFTLDQTYDDLSVSLSGSDYDTKLDIWGDCDDGNYLGYNDDYDGLQSQVDLVNVAAGTYYAKVYGYGSSFGNYVLTIHASGAEDDDDQLIPTNFSAVGGLEQVNLSWEPVQPAGARTATGFGGTIVEHNDQWYAMKKAADNEITGARGVTRAMLYERLENDGSQTRDASVIITMYDSFGDGHYCETYLVS